MGADRHAGTTAVAAAGVDEGRLARIELQDRLAAASLACQALFASSASVVPYERNGRYLGLDRVEHPPAPSIQAIEVNVENFKYPIGVCDPSIARLRPLVKWGRWPVSTPRNSTDPAQVGPLYLLCYNRAGAFHLDQDWVPVAGGGGAPIAAFRRATDSEVNA